MLFVPSNLTVTLATTNNTDYGKLMLESELDKKLKYFTIASMGVFFLMEKQKGKDSFFFNYIDTMPGTEEFPIFYGDEEKFILKGSPFLDMIDVSQEQ